MDFDVSFSLPECTPAIASDAPAPSRCDLLRDGLAFTQHEVFAGVGQIAAHLQRGFIVQTRDCLRGSGSGRQRWIVLHPVNKGIADHEVEELIVGDRMIQSGDLALQLVEEIHDGTQTGSDS